MDPAIAPTVPDFESIPLEDLRSSLAAGQAPEIPAAEAPAEPVAEVAEAAEPATEEADPAGDAPAEVDPAPAEPVEPEIEAEPVEETEPVEAAPVDDIAERAANFAFTEGADAETRAAEEATYLGMVELSPQVEAMIAARDTMIAELSLRPEAGAVDDLQRVHTDAFDTLVTFRQDENGIPVPDTTAIRALLSEHYPQEREQLITDLLIEPSLKYDGYTLYQEFLRDMGGLDEGAMSFLGNYLESGGRMAVPSYIPRGIDPNAGEAYWNNPEREEITDKVEKALYIMDSDRASDEEVAEARTVLQNINRNLGIIQKGINADIADRQRQQEAPVRFANEVRTAAVANYTTTTLGLIEQGKGEIAKALTMLDGPAAEVTAAGFTMLINTALSDANEYAKDAQKELSSKGIKIDWKDAASALDRLLRQEQDIVTLEKRGANIRAIDNAKKAKSDTLLTIKGMQKNIAGQIVKTLTTGAGAALRKTLDTVPKVPAVRPRVNGDGLPIGTKPNFDAMPLDELRQVAFGRKPIGSLAE